MIIDGLRILRRELLLVNMEPEIVTLTINDPEFRFRWVLSDQIGPFIKEVVEQDQMQLMGFEVKFTEFRK